MKTTIADEGANSSIKREVERHIWQGIFDAKDRLGVVARDTIELIKISPQLKPDEIEVKMVSNIPDGSGDGASKSEVTFNFDCSHYPDNLSEALGNKIVRTFQAHMGKRMDSLQRQASKIGEILAYIGEIERDSGNTARCDHCGRKLVSENNTLDCPECSKNNPSCPSCGHKTRRHGFIFACTNCGTEVKQ